MPSYTLELELLGNYITDMPGFEIWTDGTLEGSPYSISNNGTSISITVNYGGTLPSSLEFRFDDASGEGGRTIEIRTVKINDRYVNTGNYLSDDSLTNGSSSTVDIASADFIFDPSEPDPSLFTTGATQTFTGANDTYRKYTETVDQTFDMLGGRDVAILGSGDDKVNGGAGNDVLRGGAGNDILFGDIGNDRLIGEEGDDTLYGGDGNDRIQGDDGNDEIHGGDGNDRLSGNDGNDTITGGDGDDRITGGTGTNILYGDAGNDQIIGDSGVDTIDGGSGDDYIYSGAGADIVNGGDDNDIIFTDDGQDIAHGDDGNDQIYGMAGADEIYGDAGDDLLFGGSGNDTIEGGTGVDVLNGGSGADTLDGGTGNDTLHGHGLTQAEIFTILQTNPDVTYNAATNSFYQYVTTSSNIATAISTAQATTLNGIAGHLVNITSATEDAYIASLIGNNSIWIGATDAEIEGQWAWTGGAEEGAVFWQGAVSGNSVGSWYENWNANEPNDFGAGEDYAEYRGNGDVWNDQQSGNRRYVIEWDAGLMGGGANADVLSGGDGNDHLYGYNGSDTLNGDAGNDILLGGLGADTLNGGDNDDLLYGGSGGDIINGDAGDDTLFGGVGNDTLNGGADTDTANFSLSTNAINASLLAGTATGNGSDTLISIENIFGSAQNDTISGDDNANILNGSAGDDVITGGIQRTVIPTSGNVITYGGAQDGGGTTTFLDDNVGVEFQGNNWKQILGTFVLTADTVLEFDYRSTIEAEVSGIGFDVDNGISAGFTFQLHGTQNWGIQDFNNYDGSGDWFHYRIDVGSFLTGTATRLTFANDDDGNSPANGTDGNGFFKNIILHEGDGAGNNLLGGDGADELYGDTGVDTFVFEDTNDIDIVHYFNNTEGDILDISGVIDFGAGSITDYLRFTNDGDHTTVAIDANGSAGGGAGFVDIAEIRGQVDLDEATLFANSQIIV